MEFCDGGSLKDIMGVLKRPLNETELAAVMRGILVSLVYVHSLNRVHRDIKAGNLLVTSAGLVKLCDFGVSAQLDDSLSKTGTRIGSPYWMAPEVIESKGHNTKADIWSLGITALELINGQPPLSELPGLAAMMKVPKSPSPQAPASASAALKDFVQSALIKDPEARPAAEALLQHKFITTVGERASGEVVRSLVSAFVAAKAAGGGDEGEEEEEEEEDKFEDDDGFNVQSPGAAATILFNDATVQGGAADAAPGSPKMAAAQKRNFRNFN
jgi:serine/threonine protein kinase